MSNGSASISVRSSSFSFDWVKGALYAALGGVVYYAYCVRPVERDVSCHAWLVGHWIMTSNYSHGPLIPFIALFLLWWNLSRRSESAAANWKPFWVALGCSAGVELLLPDLAQWMNPAWSTPVRTAAFYSTPFLLAWPVWAVRKQLGALQEQPVGSGAWVVAFAMGLYYIGVKANQPRLVVASLVVLFYGLALSFGGRELFHVLFFPITFLFLMIPMNFLDELVGFRLRIFVAQASTILLNWLGIETLRVGTGIYSRVFKFDVADPCSGIRSLMALTTVTAAYAYVTQKSQWKRWVLFLSAMPLAVLGNMARVVSIALVAEVYGQEIAGSIYHEWSGFILFPVALGAMVVLGVLLNFSYRTLWESWMRPIERSRPRGG